MTETAAARDEDSRAQASRRAQVRRAASGIGEDDARVPLRLVPPQLTDLHPRAEARGQDPRMSCSSTFALGNRLSPTTYINRGGRGPRA